MVSTTKQFLYHMCIMIVVRFIECTTQMQSQFRLVHSGAENMSCTSETRIFPYLTDQPTTHPTDGKKQSCCKFSGNMPNATGGIMGREEGKKGGAELMLRNIF